MSIVIIGVGNDEELGKMATLNRPFTQFHNEQFEEKNRSCRKNVQFLNYNDFQDMNK